VLTSYVNNPLQNTIKGFIKILNGFTEIYGSKKALKYPKSMKFFTSDCFRHLMKLLKPVSFSN